MNQNAITVTNKVARAAKARNKATWKQTLDDLSERIFVTRQGNNGAVPHRFMANLIAAMKNECPWLNRDIINYHYNRWSSKRVQDDVVVAIAPIVSTHDEVSIMNQPETLPERNKGGCPKGTTNRIKKELSDAIIAAKNKIVVNYCEEAERNGQSNALKKNTLSNIIREMRRKRNLPDNVEIKTDYIRQRVR